MTLSDLVKTESHKDAVVTEVPQPQVTGAAAVEEAMPGIGIKIDSTSGTVSVSVTVKAAADFKLAFEQEIAVGIDCSTSMRYNGGYQGVGHMIEMASTYAKELQENGNIVKARVFFFEESVFLPTSSESRQFVKISQWSSELTRHLLDTLKGDGMTNIEDATYEGIHLLDSKDPNVLLGLVLMTDGEPSVGNCSASAIRSLLDVYRRDRPLYLHAIAMGNNPKSDWLKTYVGKDGMVGYAPTPEHVGNAFKDVIGKLQGIDAIFYAKVTVLRNSKVVNERTHQLGVKTPRKVMAKFDIAFLEPEMRLQPGDVIVVSSMGHTETFDVDDGSLLMTRGDLWDEYKMTSQVDADLNEAQDLAESGSVSNAMKRVETIAARPGPEAVRNRSMAVFRSLVSQTTEESEEEHEEEDEEEEDEEEDEEKESNESDGPMYRSLSAGMPSRKKKNVGKDGVAKKARTDNLSAGLAVVSSVTSSQY